MPIWVDADACPKPVKEILFRAADRVRIEVVLVANQPLYLPKSRWVRQMTVAHGFDVADEHIVEQVSAGDLVITADIPLAAAVVERGAECLTFRGETIDAANATSRLSVRDFMDEARAAGGLFGGPSAFSDRDKRQFAGALDRWLALHR